MAGEMTPKKFVRLICLEMGDEDFEREALVQEIMTAFGRLTSETRDPQCEFMNQAHRVLDELARKRG